MAGPLFMGDISRSAIGSRFHIDRIRRVHIMLQARQVKPPTARRQEGAQRRAATEFLKERADSSGLRSRAVLLRGWLAVTEEEKCDRKLAMPFN